MGSKMNNREQSQVLINEINLSLVIPEEPVHLSQWLLIVNMISAQIEANISIVV